jgi:hypothetical protein
LGRYSYLRDRRGGHLLYDWVQDPGEQNDLSADLPELTASMSRRFDHHLVDGLAIQQFLRSLDPEAPESSDSSDGKSEGPMLSPEVEKQLRALGYLGG